MVQTMVQAAVSQPWNGLDSGPFDRLAVKVRSARDEPCFEMHEHRHNTAPSSGNHSCAGFPTIVRRRFLGWKNVPPGLMTGLTANLISAAGYL